MSPARTVPILPCRSIDEQAGSYTSVGFAVTYRGTRPSPYLEVTRGGLVLQFHGLAAHVPGSRRDLCLALFDDPAEVDALHGVVRSGLRAAELSDLAPTLDRAADLATDLAADPVHDHTAPRGD